MAMAIDILYWYRHSRTIDILYWYRNNMRLCDDDGFYVERRISKRRLVEALVAVSGVNEENDVIVCCVVARVKRAHNLSLLKSKQDRASNLREL